MRDAAEGAIIVIERRGEPVAELRPITRARRNIKFPDMSRFWNDFPRLAQDSTQLIEEDRERNVLGFRLHRQVLPE